MLVEILIITKAGNKVADISEVAKLVRWIDLIQRHDVEDVTYTGAVGRLRRTRVGSSSSSSGSESGFSCMGKSSASESELLSISSIEMIFEEDWTDFFGLIGPLLLTDFDT